MNFQLTSEVRKLRSELVALRALRMHEDCLELARFKEAYDELEKEVVALRQENIKLAHQAPVAAAAPSPSDELVLVLRDQLSHQSRRFDDLQAKYSQLRKELIASPAVSTCPSVSPDLSVVSLADPVVIGVCTEALFKRPEGRRMAPMESRKEEFIPPGQSRPEVRPKPISASIERLAKKARFSLKK